MRPSLQGRVIGSKVLDLNEKHHLTRPSLQEWAFGEAGHALSAAAHYADNNRDTALDTCANDQDGLLTIFSDSHADWLDIGDCWPSSNVAI